MLQVRLTGVFEELGSTNLDPLPLSLLLSHPVLQEVISMCTTYKAVVSCSFSAAIITAISDSNSSNSYSIQIMTGV